MTNANVEAKNVDPEQTENNVDPEQTAPIGAVWSGSTLFDQKAFETFQQMTKADDFCCIVIIRVNCTFPITEWESQSDSVPERILLKDWFEKKNQQATKNHVKLPRMQRVNCTSPITEPQSTGQESA